jgi:hypothetical protein
MEEEKAPTRQASRASFYQHFERLIRWAAGVSLTERAQKSRYSPSIFE